MGLLAGLRRAHRAGVADRIQDVANGGDCVVRRDAQRRIPVREQESREILAASSQQQVF